MNIAGQGFDVETSKLFDGRQRQPRLQVGLGRQEEEERRHVQLLRKAATPLGLWNGLHYLFVTSLAQGQEVEFHEIEIQFFMRSNSWDRIFCTFHEVKIPNNYSISWSHNIFHEIKIA